MKIIEIPILVDSSINKDATPIVYHALRQAAMLLQSGAIDKVFTLSDTITGNNNIVINSKTVKSNSEFNIEAQMKDLVKQIKLDNVLDKEGTAFEKLKLPVITINYNRAAKSVTQEPVIIMANGKRIGRRHIGILLMLFMANYSLGNSSYSLHEWGSSSTHLNALKKAIIDADDNFIGLLGNYISKNRIMNTPYESIKDDSNNKIINNVFKQMDIWASFDPNENQTIYKLLSSGIISDDIKYVYDRISTLAISPKAVSFGPFNNPDHSVTFSIKEKEVETLILRQATLLLKDFMPLFRMVAPTNYSMAFDECNEYFDSILSVYKTYYLDGSFKDDINDAITNRRDRNGAYLRGRAAVNDLHSKLRDFFGCEGTRVHEGTETSYSHLSTEIKKFLTDIPGNRRPNYGKVGIRYNSDNREFRFFNLTRSPDNLNNLRQRRLVNDKKCNLIYNSREQKLDIRRYFSFRKEVINFIDDICNTLFSYRDRETNYNQIGLDPFLGVQYDNDNERYIRRNTYLKEMFAELLLLNIESRMMCEILNMLISEQNLVNTRLENTDSIQVGRIFKNNKSGFIVLSEASVRFLYMNLVTQDIKKIFQNSPGRANPVLSSLTNANISLVMSVVKKEYKFDSIVVVCPNGDVHFNLDGYAGSGRAYAKTINYINLMKLYNAVAKKWGLPLSK